MKLLRVSMKERMVQGLKSRTQLGQVLLNKRHRRKIQVSGLSKMQQREWLLWTWRKRMSYTGLVLAWLRHRTFLGRGKRTHQAGTLKSHRTGLE